MYDPVMEYELERLLIEGLLLGGIMMLIINDIVMRVKQYFRNQKSAKLWRECYNSCKEGDEYCRMYNAQLLYEKRSKNL